ncbi:hypothetical protein BJX63DRAFT_388202 [Aspergillus granulosus]|uniref:Uncharacterized protein n=1 Tax=Aspergillus granulosus TaxID=176169 RepID=A0ABR4HLN2_9EURO
MSLDYIKRPKWDIFSEIPNLEGKVAIVTGANSNRGIGYYIAKYLAQRRATVYIGARSADKAQAAIREMKKSDDSLLLYPFVADLGDIGSIRAATKAFIAVEKRLDILVNNAGLLARPLDMNSQGLSVSIATNHIGPFVLTTELLPLLKDTAQHSPGVRIVTVASTAHILVPNGLSLQSVEDLNQDFGGVDDMQSNTTRYGFSKLANILFTKELQARLDKEEVQGIAVALHPGGVKTDGSINVMGGKDDNPLLDSALTPEEGALTPLFAAAHPTVWEDRQRYAGAYLMPFADIEDESDNAKNPQLAQALWEITEQAIKRTPN